MTPFILLLLLFLFSLILIYFLYRRVLLLQQQLEEVQFSYQSANVKHGKRWEQFAPFMDSFSQVANKENFSFLGMPIDGVCFDDDAIKFIEFKTGLSKLSSKQQQIKHQVDNKQIKWIELRF